RRRSGRLGGGGGRLVGRGRQVGVLGRGVAGQGGRRSGRGLRRGRRGVRGRVHRRRAAHVVGALVRDAGGGGDADDRHRGDRHGDPAVTLDGALTPLALQSFIECAVAGQELALRPARAIQFWFTVSEVEG